MPRYKKGSVERAVYKDLQSLAKAAPVGSKARERETVAQPSPSYSMPTLDMRQTHIILVMIDNAMRAGLVVDNKPVTADEWQRLLRAMFLG